VLEGKHVLVSGGLGFIGVPHWYIVMFRHALVLLILK
jgi:hypothetical protein